jgi:hypothetical protein
VINDGFKVINSNGERVPVISCPICGAIVLAANLEEHHDWHRVVVVEGHGQ